MEIPDVELVVQGAAAADTQEVGGEEDEDNPCTGIKVANTRGWRCDPTTVPQLSSVAPFPRARCTTALHDLEPNQVFPFPAFSLSLCCPAAISRRRSPSASAGPRSRSAPPRPRYHLIGAEDPELDSFDGAQRAGAVARGRPAVHGAGGAAASRRSECSESTPLRRGCGASLSPTGEPGSGASRRHPARSFPFSAPAAPRSRRD